jgi:hypothetical protein
MVVLMVVELGWPPDRHGAWLTRLLEIELLDR